MRLDEADIVFETPEVIAVNKPPTMPSQATTVPSERSVLPALSELLAQLRRARRQLWLVHRLDRETSGLLLVAASAARAAFLAKEFRSRRMAKTYLAICMGEPASAAFTETAPLSSIDAATRRVRVSAGGKAAVTHVQLLAASPKLGVCLLACRPQTGRSHQIRVHLAHNGLPIVGDKVYGGAAASQLPAALADLASVHHFLHAFRLSFGPGPGSARLELEAALPPRFAACLAAAGLALPAMAPADTVANAVQSAP